MALRVGEDETVVHCYGGEWCGGMGDWCLGLGVGVGLRLRMELGVGLCLGLDLGLSRVVVG